MKKPIRVIEKGEVVFYKDLNGALSLYKVLNVDINFTGTEATLQQIDYSGGLGKKKFTTSLLGKKGSNEGKQRIFRSWLQPGDMVLIKEANNQNGKVETLYCEETLSGVFTNKVDVTSSNGMRYVYTLDEASEKLELVNYEI